MSLAVGLGLISFTAAVVSALIAANSRRASERFRASTEARSRLQVATGALQLELFLETRSFARRLVHYFHESGKDHQLEAYRDHAEPGHYHDGGMMIYRILRPFTVGEIIETQTLAADLLLDPRMMDMVRFSHAGLEMLTGDRIGRQLGGEEMIKGFEMGSCWDVGRSGSGFQRIRGSYLRCGAAALVAPPEGKREPRRCITHAEFCQLWEKGDREPRSPHGAAFHEGLEPMKATINRFNRYENPVLWLRLVGYAYVCEQFYDRMWRSLAGERFRRQLGRLGRRPVKVEKIGVPAVEMLEDLVNRGGDQHQLNRYIAANASGFVERFDAIFDTAL